MGYNVFIFTPLLTMDSQSFQHVDSLRLSPPSFLLVLLELVQERTSQQPLLGPSRGAHKYFLFIVFLTFQSFMIFI